ncbi:MAG TPA: hypothetical protein VED40_05315 [Azospirillaceae bacterium]|nr:hypothetical protein [Azospirillaceae bacterium]
MSWRDDPALAAVDPDSFDLFSIDMARMAGIGGSACIDRLPHPVGTTFKEVPVITPDQLRGRPAEPITLVTLGFKDARPEDLPRVPGDRQPIAIMIDKD